MRGVQGGRGGLFSIPTREMAGQMIYWQLKPTPVAPLAPPPKERGPGARAPGLTIALAKSAISSETSHIAPMHRSACTGPASMPWLSTPPRQTARTFRDRTSYGRRARPIRAIAERIWSIAIFTFNSLDPPMVPPSKRQSGFSGKPLALRRRILEVLERAHRLTAFEIASSAFAERIVLGGRARCSTAQLVSVRRALRRLADRGHVVSHCRQRRWKMWERQK